MDDDFFLPFEQKYTNDDHSTEGKDQKEDKDVSKHENGPDFIALQPNNEYKVEVVARPKKKIKAGWPKLNKADSKVASNSDINEDMEEQKGFLKHVITLSSDAIQWSDEESGQVDSSSHTDETTTIYLESPTMIAPKSDESGEKNSFSTKSQTENIEPVIDEIMAEGDSSNVETQAISEAVSNLRTIVRKKQRTKKKKGKTTTTKSNTVPKIAETVKTFVKKSRVFQVQRITRRIALLRKKKGDCQQLNKNERKIKRMLEHIEVLKNINLDVYSENIAKCLVDCIKSNRLLQEESSGYKWLETALIEKQIDSTIVEKLLKMNTFLRYLGMILFANQDPSADKEMDNERINQTSNQTDTIEACIENDPKEEEDCTEKSNQETEVTKQKRMSTNYSKGLNAKSFKSDEKKDVKFDCLDEHETAASIKESTQLPDEEFNEVTVAEEKVVLITGTQPENKKQKVSIVRNRNSAKKANGIAVSKRADSKTNKFDKEKLDAKNKTRFADALRKVQGTRGNRLGQRARRELWEKMFGSDAIHVKRGDRCEWRGKRKRQADMGNKKARDTDKRKGFERSKKKAKTAKEEENLHPSWQAKKEQKHQAQIVQFKGNKITFDD